MPIHTVGIDIAKSIFHLVALDETGRAVAKEEVIEIATADLHSEPSGRHHRDGGLLRFTLSGTSTGSARA